jgi:hypothetical protein
MASVFTYTERTTDQSPLIRILESYGEKINKLELAVQLLNDRVKELEDEKNQTNVKLS